MIDQVRFEKILTRYMSDFPRRWTEDQESFKWEAVAHFRKNWDIDSPRFAEMLSRSLAKTAGLLANANNFPMGMLLEFANAAPEELRVMFQNLLMKSRMFISVLPHLSKELKRCALCIVIILLSIFKRKMQLQHTYG